MSTYKAINNGPYLSHFNKNHSSKNGQFISGDGDSDGVIDDHHNYKRNKSVSKKLSKYTGKDAQKNLEKDGFMKVANRLSKEYGKRYKDGSGENTKAADEKYNKKLEDLETKVLEKYKQKGKINKDGSYEWDSEITNWYNKEYDKIVEQDRIDYGRAWMKDLGIGEQDADTINRFLGKY